MTGLDIAALLVVVTVTVWATVVRSREPWSSADLFEEASPSAGGEVRAEAPRSVRAEPSPAPPWVPSVSGRTDPALRVAPAFPGGRETVSGDKDSGDTAFDLAVGGPVAADLGPGPDEGVGPDISRPEPSVPGSAPDDGSALGDPLTVGDGFDDDAAAGDHLVPELTVSVIHSRGVQVRDHNTQISVYTYRLASPRFIFDLDSILADQRVRAAFFELVADPDDAAANRAFRKSLSQEAIWISSGHKASTPDVGGTDSFVGRLLHRTVFVERSRDAQVGDHRHQFNAFDYRIINPNIEVEALLRRNAELVTALVTAVCSDRSREVASLGRALEVTCRGAEISLPDFSPDARVITSPDGVRATDVQRGQIGDHNVAVATDKIRFVGHPSFDLDDFEMPRIPTVDAPRWFDIPDPSEE